jgi:hypothetical protein
VTTFFVVANKTANTLDVGGQLARHSLSDGGSGKTRPPQGIFTTEHRVAQRILKHGRDPKVERNGAIWSFSIVANFVLTI